MNNLFFILFLVSFIALITGLIRPTVFSRFIKVKITRKKIAKIFGITTVVTFVLFGMTTDTHDIEKITEQNTIQTTTNNNTLKEEPQQKQVSYEILERWSFPNGGEGKKILISKEYMNDTDMIALGNKLKQDTADDRNAIIQVYTDKQAATLRDKVLADNATQAENNLYDEHFVGFYTKNANSGNHQFNIFFDGTMGTNQKTIKY